MATHVVRLRLLVLLLAFASCSSNTGGPDPDPVAAVGGAFEAYRSALIDQNGVAAAESVSSATIRQYQEYRDLAVSGDETTVKNLSMMNRMQVLLFRHRVGEKLKAMDGKAVFAHAVEQNWIGKDGVVRAGLKDIAVQGTRATARVTVDGKITAERFHFIGEDGSWRIDLLPTIKSTDQVLQAAAEKRGISEDEFLFSIITSLSGRKVTDEIWRPLE